MQSGARRSEPVRVVRTYRPARLVEYGSAEHRRARYHDWATTTWVAFWFVVLLLLLVGMAWLVTHDWRPT